MAPSVAHYDRLTITLHWLTALFVAGLWAMGQTIDFFPRGPGQDFYRSLHVAVGLLLVAIFAFRIYWRRTGGRQLPDPQTGLANTAAKAMHHILYLVLALVLLGGVANAFGHNVKLFGLIEFPDFFSHTVHRLVNSFHKWGANALLALAVLHAGAAVWHRLWVRDGIFQRMLPETN